MASNQPAPYLAEQFDDLEQQQHADFMGMWMYLGTELLLFAGVFMGFAINRYLHPAAFGDAAHKLDLLMGSINTGILLTSGLTMALAERAVVIRERRLTQALLGATLVLGLIFLCIKGYEYHTEYTEQLLPITGLPFKYEGAHAAYAQMFFNFYFVLTAMHALHMAIGLAIIAVLMGIGHGWRQPDRFERQVRIVGLYWAFVDIVWIFVFTSLYLLRS